MPQYQGVWTLEQQAQAQSNQQWVTDPNFKNTTLLLQADGTGSGSQNNTFLDGSTNNFFITRNGNTTQGSFSPFSQAPGYWGNYFDGTDDFYTSSTALFNYTIANASTQTATIEAFVYITAFQSAPANIWENPCIAGKGDTYMNFGVNASGNLFIYHYDGAARTTTSSGTLSANAWNHVAAVISGGTITLYINGTSSGSGTWYGIDAGGQNSTSYFGETPDADSRAWLGYISNLRVSTTARTITVPTSPYVNEGNTAFLTFQSNRVVDNSSNAYAITASGTPSVQAFGPFAPALQWTPTVVGGSGYFDGTTDYLDVGSNANLTIGTNNFTIAFWAYFNSFAASAVIFEGRSSAVADAVIPQINATFGTGSIDYRVNGVARITGTSSFIKVGQWYYIVVSRLSGTTKLFINGAQQGSDYTDSNNYIAFASDRPRIGDRGNSSGVGNPFSGYLSGLQILVGAGISSSTIPTAPPTNVANTQLLLNYTNAGIYDGTMQNSFETVGDAQVSTSVVKYGSGSIKFDGTGDYIQPAGNYPGYVFGTGNFTIEFWAFFNSTANCVLYEGRPGVNGAYIRIDYNTNALRLYANTGVQITGSSVATGQWNHIALCRANSQTKLFLNGVQTGSTYADTTSYLSGTNRPRIADGDGGGEGFNGFIDDLRITKGVARYVTNFTPPQQALPRQ